MTTISKHAKLSLVGAGPGAIDLITVKGINALKQADIVLYDALVNTDLLDYAPANAHKIFVGKREGVPSAGQDAINKLIVEYALTHGHVVRLKGGDPFVFGRGHEELAYAKAFGIPVEVVPGISSSISLAALQQIPVTSRGYSDSFWVITGTTKTGELSTEIYQASKSNATVVILMGINKLAKIAEVFQESGKGETAVALIQNGSLPNEKIALGSIDTIVEVAAAQQIEAPAVIIIGKVVELHPSFLAQYYLANAGLN